MTIATGNFTQKQQYWHHHLQQCAQQGLTVAQYARESGLAPRNLYYWQSRFTKQSRPIAQSNTATADFIKAVVLPSTSCRIVFPNGIALEFSHAVDAPLLTQLAALRIAP